MIPLDLRCGSWLHSGMNQPLQQYAFLEKFRCLGDQCPDTCCHGWQMPTDARQRALYAEKAPELLAATDPQARVMRRDPATDFCVKLEGGLCQIHAEYGEDFLSDACYFYPRLTRDFEETRLMTASLSCPEILRLQLTEAEPFALRPLTATRLPTMMPQPLEAGMTWEAAQMVMQKCMRMAQDSSRTPEASMAKIIRFSMRLHDLPQAAWASAQDDEAPMVATPVPSDPHALLYTLGVLIMRAPVTKRARLEASIRAMETALDCQLGWQQRDMQMGAQAGTAWARLRERWIHSGAADAMAETLRRWIQGQLAAMGWPFAGFAATTLAERTTVLAVRFATVRLALMSVMDVSGAPPTQEEAIACMQGIARLMDHLADADLSRLLYRDAGWLNSTPRLLALVGI